NIARGGCAFAARRCPLWVKSGHSKSRADVRFTSESGHYGGGLQNSFAGLAQNHPRKFAPSFPRYDEVSAAMESSARFAVVLLLRHGGLVAAEFSEDHYQLVGTVKPRNTHAVVSVVVPRDLEHVGRSVVVKFHSQCIRREDVVSDVTTPLPGDVFICGRVCDFCGQYPTRK